MRQCNRKYRRTYLWVAALTAIALGGVASGGAAPADSRGHGGFRSFCVGSSCDPPPLIVTIPVEQPAPSPLSFSFSINFDEVTFLDGTGFAFLDVLDEQGQELFKMTAQRVFDGVETRYVLSLQYRISNNLFGNLSVGELVDGEECFRVEKTMTLGGGGFPFSTAIRILRSRSEQDYETEPIFLSESASVVRQGVLELYGEPGGTVLITDAVIGYGCPTPP